MNWSMDNCWLRFRFNFGVWNTPLNVKLKQIIICIKILNKYINIYIISMQGKLFQRCTHLLYCSVLSLSGNVNTRRMSQTDMGSIFSIKNQWNILVKGSYNVNYQNYQNSMLLSSSDTKQTLMHLFLFTNSAQKKLVSTWTQSLCDCN